TRAVAASTSTPGACCRGRPRPARCATCGNERRVHACARHDAFLTASVGRCRPQNAAQEAPMSNPKNPNEHDSLSRAPSGRGGRRAELSHVQGGRLSPEAPAPKPAAEFSNVQGGASSSEETIREQTYTVQKGDTLSHIAKQFYGKAGAWNRIFEANRDQLDNPDLIQPGQVLKIPPQAD